MIKIFDRYIAFSVGSTTFYGVSVLSVVLVIGNVFKNLLKRMAEHPDLEIWFALEFMANILPFSLIFTIPWGFLTAILLTFGRLSADNELGALRMAGLSTPRICAPIFVIAGVLVALCLYLNLQVAPASKSRINNMFFELATERPMALFQPGEIVSSLPGFVAFVESREVMDEETGDYRLRNFQIVKLTEDDEPMAFAVADAAELEMDEETKDNLFFQMSDAHFENHTGIQDDDFLSMQYYQAGLANLQVSLQQLKESSRKVRTSYMPLAELRDHLNDKRAEVEAATDPAERRKLEGERSKILTDLNKRLSLSFACLTFCFVGIPLGVTAQRRETSIGFTLSLITSICYFLFIVIAENLNDKPAAYPHLLIWLPNVIFLTVGGLLFYRLCQK